LFVFRSTIINQPNHHLNKEHEQEIFYEDHEIILDGATSVELNNDGFEIDHKDKEGFWKTLGFVDESGSTVNRQEYQFFDENPAKGINYCQL